MGDFLELTRYSPNHAQKEIVIVNKKHISALESYGVYTVITLFCGKEIKVTEAHRSIKKLAE